MGGGCACSWVCTKSCRKTTSCSKKEGRPLERSHSSTATSGGTCARTSRGGQRGGSWGALLSESRGRAGVAAILSSHPLHQHSPASKTEADSLPRPFNAPVRRPAPQTQTGGTGRRQRAAASGAAWRAAQVGAEGRGRGRVRGRGQQREGSMQHQSTPEAAQQVQLTASQARHTPCPPLQRTSASRAR